MEAKRFHQLLGYASALYFIGSATVAQAQGVELPFVPVLTIGSTELINDGVVANSDGSFTVLGNQLGGLVNGQPVWDLSWNLTLNQDPSIIGSATLTNLTTTTRNFNLAFSLPITPAFSPSVFGGSITATVMDANVDSSATMAPIAVSPSIYRGTIDSVTVLSLLGAIVTCTGSSAGCSSVSTDDFGLQASRCPVPRSTAPSESS